MYSVTCPRSKTNKFSCSCSQLLGSQRHTLEASRATNRSSPLGTSDRTQLVPFEHHRVRRRVDIQPDDVTQFGDEFRSRDSLNCRTRCGWRPCERQIRCTEE